MDYTKMSAEELQRASSDIRRKRNELKKEAVKIQAEISRRHNQEKLDRMSDKEKDSLRQLLSAKGIDSSEKVGKPQ